MVINLGTNDQKKGTEREAYIAGVKALIQYIRQQYGNVNVVWTCGMMTENVMSPWLETAIESLGGWENGLYICRLNNDRTGGNGHPSADAHEEASGLLYDFIKENGLI